MRPLVSHDTIKKMHPALHRLRRSAAWVVVAVVTVSCAHAVAPGPSGRELASLERKFAAFTATRLQRLADIEAALAWLEEDRVAWLDFLVHAQGAAASTERSLALLRLAELHLDLAARIRRVPYPPAASDRERSEFDATLSRHALALEATGQGILAQLIDTSVRERLDGRFVRRARVYLRLQRSRPLGPSDVQLVERELTAATFRAPTTLLQVGRIGQRAARSTLSRGAAEIP